MTRSARALLLAALLATPAYLALDVAGLVPVSLRDRPWPFALAAFALTLAALRSPSRSRTLSLVAALVVALASSAALAMTAHWRYRLPPSSATAEVGAPLPDVSLHDESGNLVPLGSLRDRPTLLVWFRGSWCPYCRRQLAELAAQLRPFSPDDFRLLAVADDPPEPLLALKRELQLPFSLLSDPDRRLMSRCELAHCVALLDGKGVVRWAVISGNWERDLPARALLQAAYRLR